MMLQGMPNQRRASALFLCLALITLQQSTAFQPIPSQWAPPLPPYKSNTNIMEDGTTRHFMFFAEEAPPDSLNIEIVPSGDDQDSMNEAAEFLIDAFWLDARHLVAQPAEGAAPQQQQQQDVVTVQVSEDARRRLYRRQATDLFDNYGERMGKRLLDNAVIKAMDTKTNEILGLVCVSSLLFDDKKETLLTLHDSEELLLAAVASLGPKDRRNYKNASAEDIVSGLLGNNLEAVCCLSNLAVSPKARRSGIAARLCDEAERLASVEWGFDVMFLKVEADNTAARNLYEQKLGYALRCKEMAASAMRVDLESGNFVVTEADTLILMKEI